MTAFKICVGFEFSYAIIWSQIQ